MNKKTPQRRQDEPQERVNPLNHRQWKSEDKLQMTESWEMEPVEEQGQRVIPSLQNESKTNKTEFEHLDNCHVLDHNKEVSKSSEERQE